MYVKIDVKHIFITYNSRSYYLIEVSVDMVLTFLNGLYVYILRKRTSDVYVIL